MVRLAVTPLLAVLALTFPARAEDEPEIWQPAGPIATSAGMNSVASDPDDPKVVWLGGTTTVWVSEDEGQTFHLVLQLARATGLLREIGGQAAEEAGELVDDPEARLLVEAELEDQGPTEDALTADDILLLDTGDSRPVREVGNTEDDIPDEDDEQAVQVRFGVVRMRVIGDRLYVCTSRGLYSVARAARRVGTGHELRFGRRVAVNDVAATPDGQLWIATDGGLYQLGRDGIGRPARGLEEDLAVRALGVSEGRVVAATSRGLRIASMTVDGFDRLSIGGREDAGLEDILVEPDARILVAGSDQVARIMVRPGEVPFTEQLWNVPGAARLALGRGGTRWAVGAKGAWRLREEGSFQRMTEGLFDRRLRDVAIGHGPLARLWAVGRTGAWRLVADTGRGYSASAARLAEQALEGFPDDDKVLNWALAARGTSLARIEGWALEQRLSWLLPRIELRWQWVRQREEDHLQVPILDRRILNAVEVRPTDDNFRFMAYWDVMPALLAALEGTQSVFESSRVRARRELERVREVVMPVYHAWARKRIDLAAREELGLRETLREILAIQRLESDLHVYTDGRFPVSPTGNKTLKTVRELP